MQAFGSFFLHFYAFFLKFDTPSIENRHALKSQINALSAPFHISPARDYMRPHMTYIHYFSPTSISSFLSAAPCIRPRVSRKRFARPLRSQCGCSTFPSRSVSSAFLRIPSNIIRHFFHRKISIFLHISKIFCNFAAQNQNIKLLCRKLVLFME